MRVKIITLFLLSFFSLCTMQALSKSNFDLPEQIEKSDIPPGMTEINMEGTLIYYNPGQYSVEAFLCRSYVQVNFHQNFGYVNLTLIGDTGDLVYSGNVNTAVQQTVYIPIAGIPSGNYTLVLDNANGEAEGDFAKQ